MKFVLSALAALALSVQPAFAAEHTHGHGAAAQAAPAEAAVPAGAMCDHENTLQKSLQKMRAQMDAINQTKDLAKRQRLLKEHNKSMRDSLKILREMTSGTAVAPAPAGAMPGRMMGGRMMSERMMGGNMDPMKCDHAKGEPAASAGESASASGNAVTGPAKKLWICPMHPDEVQDRPGMCKICGMDLVDKEELDAPPPGPSSTQDTMKCDHRMGGMKDCCMSGSGAKCDHMMGGMSGMSGMPGRHMGAILALMEQLIAHNEAVLSLRK
ncbi:MAG: hypothetical protein HY846_02930 [Nitrosomonadales bacterium]|nr:hypothetical protein [Nitrosomonadales bacterium]